MFTFYLHKACEKEGNKKERKKKEVLARQAGKRCSFFQTRHGVPQESTDADAAAKNQTLCTTTRTEK